MEQIILFLVIMNLYTIRIDISVLFINDILNILYQINFFKNGISLMKNVLNKVL